MGGAYESVTVDVNGNVAQVTLVGPGKGNAMGPAFWSELPAVFTELDDVPETLARLQRGVGVQPNSALALALDNGSHVVPNAVAG
jgi:enoyl-CoA hydratase